VKEIERLQAQPDSPHKQYDHVAKALGGGPKTARDRQFAKEQFESISQRVIDVEERLKKLSPLNE